MILAVPARAKLNLDLEVTGRRPDGFHELRTTFQAIDLHDLLEFAPSPATRMTTEGFDVDVTDNSVRRAHEALEKAAGTPLTVAIHLHKRIPPGSGMGGASSDAAATLDALRRMFNLTIDVGPIAEQLGSDVPFFLAGGRALVEGRGERITQLPPSDAWFAIAWPGIELSTAKVYEQWDRTGGAGLRDAAERVEPRLKEFAERLGAGWRMTGSGSAFFRFAHTYDEARLALDGLDCWKAVSRTVA